MVYYLEQCCCKKLPIEFDLWGLRKPIVSPKRGHPMCPGGKFGASCFLKKFTTRKDKTRPKHRANIIGKVKTIVPDVWYLLQKKFTSLSILWNATSLSCLLILEPLLRSLLLCALACLQTYIYIGTINNRSGDFAFKTGFLKS